MRDIGSSDQKVTEAPMELQGRLLAVRSSIQGDVTSCSHIVVFLTYAIAIPPLSLEPSDSDSRSSCSSPTPSHKKGTFALHHRR